MSKSYETIHITFNDSFELWLIQEAAKFVYNSVQQKTYHEFQNNERLKNAVEDKIKDIGLEASLLSKEFRRNSSEFGWKYIISLYHILDDEEGEIKNEILWNISTHFIPEILKSLEPFRLSIKM